jgi:hypothetical protein
MNKVRKNGPTRKQMERLLYAVHNWGWGYEGGKIGEAWDAGAEAALQHLFGIFNRKAFKDGYDCAMALYRECASKPKSYIEERIQEGLAG